MKAFSELEFGDKVEVRLRWTDQVTVEGEVTANDGSLVRVQLLSDVRKVFYFTQSSRQFNPKTNKLGNAQLVLS